MQVRPAQLAGQLERSLAPLYAIHGEEPLLALEAADAVRAAARARGYTEREVLVVESGFDWSQLAASARSLSLFGSQRVIDLRLPSGKPGLEGGKALAAHAASPGPDTVTLVSLPKLDRSALDSDWFRAMDRNGVVVGVQPIERAQMPRWIGERLARQGQRAAPATLEFLAERTEGNLLAARQEIEKIGLLLPPGELALEAVEAVVSDVARYDVADLSVALLLGKRARFCRILAALRAEGEGAPLVLWQLAEDFHALWAAAEASAGGEDRGRPLRAWGKRRAPLEAAVGRARLEPLEPLVPELARLDRLSKGIGRDDFWDAAQDFGLALAGALRAAARPEPGHRHRSG